MNTMAKMFDNAAQQETSLQVTTVTGRADEWFFVQDLSVKRVKRAISCLVEPEVGDVVLLCKASGEQTSFLLSILSREHDQAGQLHLPGGVTMQTEGKQLTVHADGIDLRGRKSIGLSTVRLDVNALAVTARITHCQSWVEAIETTADRMTITVKTLTQQVGRMLARVRESWRKVEGLDETQAACMRLYVEGTHQLDADHITMNAEGFVRIDGKTINLG